MTALRTSATVNHDHTLTVTMPECGVAEGSYDVVIVLTPPAIPTQPSLLSTNSVSKKCSVPDLIDYRQMLADARRQAPPSPWRTTAEAMNALREGEEN